MYCVGDIVVYKNTDGLVKIQLLKKEFVVIGFQVWLAKVIEVISEASFGGNPKVGKQVKISERWFVEKIKE